MFGIDGPGNAECVGFNYFRLPGEPCLLDILFKNRGDLRILLDELYEYRPPAERLKAKRPDVEFVAEQWPALGKLEAGSTLQAVMQAKPDAIFNVTFGADLAKLVREGNQRNVFPKTPEVSML